MGIYEDLQVRRIINGSGLQTRLSGSIMRPEAMAAMMEASKSLVDMEHLQARASQAIAAATGAEAGLVTSGAAAALTLGTAACVTGLDITKMDKLPDTTGMKNEVVMARHHRNAYDHMIRLTGVRIVEAGLNDVGLGAGVRGVEGWEIEAAITERTAAVAYVQKTGGRPTLEEVAAIAKRHGVPLIVDAAAELPPAENLRRIVEKGASLVVFSGGKAIRGPQSTGILAGKRDLIMSAAIQMIDMDSRFETWDPPSDFIDKSKLKGIPRNGIGRGFKVGKEEVVGLITALKIYSQGDEVAYTAALERRAAHLAELLKDTKGIRAEYVPAAQGKGLPRVDLWFAGEGGFPKMVERVMRLRSDDPPIYLDESRMDESLLQVNPSNLSDDDIGVIAARLESIV
jgi:D-glucosaminate-6-phosphate ammonia-lyase